MNKRCVLPLWLLLYLMLTLPALAIDHPTVLPTGGTVVEGSATIHSSSPTALHIHQTSPTAILHWNDFSIGSEAKVAFKQPSSDAIALNRVVSNNPSEIMGKLSANGQVFLTNPNGILIGKDAQVNVGANTQLGNITVSNSIAKTAGGNASLTLRAHNNIILSSGIKSPPPVVI